MLTQRYTPGVPLEEQGFLATQHNQEFGLVAALSSRYGLIGGGEGGGAAAGGGVLFGRVYDPSPGGGVSGLDFTPPRVRVMLEAWDGTKFTVDTSAVYNAIAGHAGSFALDPLAGCCGAAGAVGDPAGLVIDWRTGIVYDTDTPAAWVVTGTSQGDSEVEVWLDAGTHVAASVSPDGTWTATLNLSSATRGAHTISAAEKFFGDSTWQTTRSYAVWRETAEADPTLRKACAPRSIAAIAPDVQDASDLGASSNDNRTSDTSPVIDCAIADPGAATTHYGRIYLSQAGATVYHDQEDNSGGAATAEGDVFAFATGSDGSASESDLTEGVYWVQVDFWGVGGTGLGLTTDDMHSGMSRPMVLRIDSEATGEGSPTRYHRRCVLAKLGDDYVVAWLYGCLDANEDDENEALDA